MRIGLITVLALLIAASAGAAKPGGGGDTTAPASIGSIAVQSAARALTLHFTAPGDDGMAGTATRYDVRYEGGSSCASAPSSEATPAARSATMKPLAAGSADLFTVRPLASGSDYCVWISALDEVGNSSSWALVQARTDGTPGQWPLAVVPPDPGAASSNLGVLVRGLVATLDDAPALGEPRVLAAWQITDTALGATSEHIIGIRLASLAAPSAGDSGPLPVCSSAEVADCAKTLLLSDPALSAHITALSSDLAVAAIPGPDVAGILVRGTTPAAKRTQPPVSKALLLERTPTAWRSEVLPFAVGWGDGQPESNLAYVPLGSAWNPVVTYVKPDPSASGRSTLWLAERMGSVWVDTPLFSRLNDGWGVRRLSQSASGELLIWVEGGNVYNAMFLQGTRSGSGWTWTHYDAGPSTSTSYSTGLDASGELVVARIRSGGSRLLAIRQSSFAGSAGNGLPTDSETGSVPLEAWQQIYEPIAGTQLSTPMGVAPDCGGAVRIAAVPLYDDDLCEVRIAADAFVGVPNAASIPVDHTHGGFEAGMVGLPNGDVALLTVWKTFRGTLKNSVKPQEDVYLVRGRLGTCP